MVLYFTFTLIISCLCMKKKLIPLIYIFVLIAVSGCERLEDDVNKPYIVGGTIANIDEISFVSQIKAEVVVKVAENRDTLLVIDSSDVADSGFTIQLPMTFDTTAPFYSIMVRDSSVKISDENVSVVLLEELNCYPSKAGEKYVLRYVGKNSAKRYSYVAILIFADRSCRISSDDRRYDIDMDRGWNMIYICQLQTSEKETVYTTNIPDDVVFEWVAFKK